MYPKSKSRRSFDDQFKARVLAECQRPGASVASVALANELNANLVHKWRRGKGWRNGPQAPRAMKARSTAVVPVLKTLSRSGPAVEPLQFVPVSLAAAPATPGAGQATNVAPTIDIELTRGATRLTVRWPVSEASECAAWLRQVAGRFK